MSIYDVAWGLLHGGGACLALDLECETLEDLAAFIQALPHGLGLTDHGSYAIHQTAVSWHGFGIRDLLEDSVRWDERYANAPGPFHHSEEAVFYGKINGGLIVLTFQQHISGRAGQLYHCEMEVRLPGIPVDPRPYQTIAQLAGAAGAHFSLLPKSDLVTLGFRRQGPKLRVGGLIVEPDRDGAHVIGVLASNPFFKNSRSISGDDGIIEAFRPLLETEYLLCNLSDQHGLEDVPDFYRISSIEALSLAVRPVISVHCTWNQMPHLQRMGIPPRWTGTPGRKGKPRRR
jgi:hypothetical protein